MLVALAASTPATRFIDDLGEDVVLQLRRGRRLPDGIQVARTGTAWRWEAIYLLMQAATICTRAGRPGERRFPPPKSCSRSETMTFNYSKSTDMPMTFRIPLNGARSDAANHPGPLPCRYHEQIPPGAVLLEKGWAVNI